MATFGGIVFLEWGIYFTINPNASKGFVTGGLDPAITSLCVGALAELIGLAVLNARPYRPDLGDSIRAYKAEIPRNWWTGEPKM